MGRSKTKPPEESFPANCSAGLLRAFWSLPSAAVYRRPSAPRLEPLMSRSIAETIAAQEVARSVAARGQLPRHASADMLHTWVSTLDCQELRSGSASMPVSTNSSPFGLPGGETSLRRFQTLPSAGSFSDTDDALRTASPLQASMPPAVGWRSASGRGLATWVTSLDAKTLEAEQRHRSRPSASSTTDATDRAVAPFPRPAPILKPPPLTAPMMLQSGVGAGEESPFSSASLLATVMTGF